MKLFIMTDIEGISGLDRIEMLGADPEGYERARKYLMADINAAVSGAFDGGADEVCILDGHGTGLNFIKEELDLRVHQLTVEEYFKTAPESWDIDAFISIGAHAMAGTENAFLDHTQSSVAWFDYKINGKSYGEIGQQAVFFGLSDIPLIMVSGDEAACHEAKTFVSGVVTASVKKACGRNRAECIPLEEAHALIYNAVKKAVLGWRDVKPVKVFPPYELEVVFTRNDYCDSAIGRDPSLEREGRRIVRRLDKITCSLDMEWF
ncbi:MAG: M55 family metallopeptidase [Clostridia bacterium]|nr:M55 family metallopeptidase [Clostridia bacterium]